MKSMIQLLCLEEGNSGVGRILLGFYKNRRRVNSKDSIIYDLTKNRALMSELSIKDALSSSNYISHQIGDKSILKTKINCVEFFEDDVRILSSMRVPNCLIKGDKSAIGLKEFLNSKSKKSIKDLRDTNDDVAYIGNVKLIDVRVTYVHRPNSKDSRLFLTIDGNTAIRYQTESSVLEI